MRQRYSLLFIGGVIGMLLARAAVAEEVTLNVGPGKTYHTVSAAVAAADADTQCQ
jgi:hypothetical protein